MKLTLPLGKPVHFRPSNDRITACGRVIHQSLLAAYDSRNVECLQCRKTKKWKTQTSS